MRNRQEVGLIAHFFHTEHRSKNTRRTKHKSNCGGHKHLYIKHMPLYNTIVPLSCVSHGRLQCCSRRGRFPHPSHFPSHGTPAPTPSIIIINHGKSPCSPSSPPDRNAPTHAHHHPPQRRSPSAKKQGGKGAAGGADASRQGLTEEEIEGTSWGWKWEGDGVLPCFACRNKLDA